MTAHMVTEHKKQLTSPNTAIFVWKPAREIPAQSGFCMQAWHTSGDSICALFLFPEQDEPCNEGRSLFAIRISAVEYRTRKDRSFNPSLAVSGNHKAGTLVSRIYRHYLPPALPNPWSPQDPKPNSKTSHNTPTICHRKRGEAPKSSPAFWVSVEAEN